MLALSLLVKKKSNVCFALKLHLAALTRNMGTTVKPWHHQKGFIIFPTVSVPTLTPTHPGSMGLALFNIHLAPGLDKSATDAR